MARPAGMTSSRNWSWVLPATGVYATAAVILTWPLARHLTDHLIAHSNPAATADSPLNAWILTWVLHALTHFPTRLFQGNIFYPAPDALAFSDTLLGNQLLFAPVYAATGNPVLGYNLTLLGAFVLNGLSLALLVRSITGEKLPALVAGFVYAFAPVRFPHLFHLQLLSAWWAPLAFLAVEAWLREPRMSRMAGAVLAVWCQFLSSAYLGLMLSVLLVPYALWRGWLDRNRLPTVRVLRDLALAGLLGTILFLPVTLPYLRSQAQWGHERGLEDQLRYSAQPLSFLAADETNRLYGNLTRRFRRQYAPWETTLFVGLVPLGLAGLGLIPWRRGRKAEGTNPATLPRGYLLVGGLAALLSLGPILLWGDEPAQWPLPYLALFLWIPGFRGMRVPARFFLITLIPLAVLAGMGTARILTWIRQRRPDGVIVAAGMVAALLAGIAAESVHTPIRLQRVQAPHEDAPVSSWLADAARSGAILEIPFSPSEPVPEALRMLQSTRHWAPMVNGYSGFRPGSYFELAALVNGQGFSDPVLDALEALGVRTLVIHLDELHDADRRLWLQDPPWSRHLELLRAGPALRLFRITPAASRSTSLQATLALPPTLPAAERFHVGLRLEEQSGGPWVNPGPIGRPPVTVIWKPAAGPALPPREVPVFLPTVLPTGRRYTTVVPLETPATPGAYRLDVQGAGFRIEHPITLEGVSPAGENPRADVSWHGPPRVEAVTGAAVEVAVRLRNRGDGVWRERAAGSFGGVPLRRLARLGGLTIWWASADLPDHGSEWRIWGAGQGALWLATPQSYLGKFTVGARWLRDGQPASTDFTPLPQDVFPGQVLDLLWIILAPREPGPYELEVAMQAPPLQPFTAAGGDDPVRVPVLIRRREGGPA
ncbi:MAG: hypothetical protein HYT85_02290 [candidate division NC10 bacterium]|nr:hypothetical protein [candidate division NC10 bacterium]